MIYYPNLEYNLLKSENIFRVGLFPVILSIIVPARDGQQIGEFV